MAKNDFVLNIGFKIDSKSISKTALKSALNKAAEGLVLNISKVKLKNPGTIRKDISKQLGAVSIDNLSVSSRAAKAFARSINDRVKPTIKGLSVSSGSLNNLRKSVERALKNVQVTVANLPRQQASGGSSAPGGNASAVTRGNERVAQSTRSRRDALLELARAEREALLGMNRFERSSLRVNQTIRQSGVTLQELGGKIGQVTKRFAEYAISVQVIRALQGTFRVAAEGVRELDDAIQDLSKVGSVGNDINLAFEALSSTAFDTGRSIKDASDAIGEFVRQGKDLETAAKFAANALKLSNISALNGADAARLVTAAQQVFGSTTEKLGSQLSSLAVFADSSATNVTEIGTAFLRSASSAEAAGLTIEQSFALLAGTLEQTRLNASTVGTAFKTILARLGRDKGKVADLANGFLNLERGQEGFIDSSGSVSDVITNLAANFSKLNSEQKNLVALQVAGVRQANVFIGLLNNFEKTQTLLNNSQEDSTALNRKNQAQLEKLSTRFTQLVTSIKTTAGALSGLTSGRQGGIAGFASDSVQSLTSVIKIFGDATQSVDNLFGGFNAGTTIVTGLAGAVAGLARTALPTVVSAGKAFLTGMQQTQQAVQGINQALTQTNQLTSQAGQNISSSRAASGGLGLVKEPNKAQFKQAAVQSALAFAAGDALRQTAGSLQDGITEIIEEAERLGTSVNQADINLRQSGAQLAESTATFAQTAALFGLKAGIIVAGIDAIAKIFTAFSSVDTAVTEAAIDSVASQARSLGAGTIVDLQTAVNSAKDSINTLKDSLDRDLKIQSLSEKFRSSIVDSTLKISEALESSALVMAGLPSEASSVLAQLNSVKTRLEGAVFSGETATGTKLAGSRDVANALAAGTLKEFDVTTEETRRLEDQTRKYKDQLAELNSEVLDAAFPLDQYIKGIRGINQELVKSSDKSKNFLRVALEGAFNTSEELRDKASRRLDAEIKRSSITDEEREKAQQAYNKSIASATKAFSNIVGSFSKLEGINFDISEMDFTNAILSGNFGRILDDISNLDKTLSKGEFIKGLATAAINLENERDELIKATELQTADVRESLREAQEQVNKAKEKTVEISKEELALQGEIAARVARSVDFADQDIEKISKVNAELIKKLSLEKEISELRDQGIRGQIRALQVEGLSKALKDENLKSLREQIALVEQVGTAEEKRTQLPKLREQEAKAVDLLKRRVAIEIAPEIDKLFKEEAAKRVEDANKRIADSYNKQAEALKNLQDSRKKVFEAEKAVSDTGQKTAQVMLSIAAAQANLSRVIESSFASIRSSVRGALTSAGFEIIGSVSSSLDLIVSQEQRLNVIRKEGLEESLRISQEQARTLLSIGERVATGGPGARLDAIRGIQTAQAIQGGADISSFTPEDIKAALSVENLFPGLKEAVQTQALATLGLDDELAALKSNIGSLAGNKAEQAAQEQLRVASSQLSALLSQLTSAENAERIANDDLALSREAANADRQKLDAARVQVALAQDNLRETQFSNRNLEKIGNLFARGASSPIPNAARGTLSGSEMAGLQAAAQREKALMPAGSKLMLANTSETVLTRKQSRSLGIRGRSQAGAVNGNGDFTGLVDIMTNLISEIRGLRADVQTGGVSNVNLQVDTNKNINVKGINGLGQRLESELRGKFASGTDVAAIESAILDILSKLGESGLTDDLGR